MVGYVCVNTAEEYLKGNNNLSMTAEQLAFLYLYDPSGVKLYLINKNDGSLTKKVFRLLCNREPQYYSWVDGSWQKLNDWSSSGYCEADLSLTCMPAPSNLIDLATMGLIGATAVIGIGEIALFAEGVSAFGFYNALTAYSYGGLGSQLASWKVLTQLENRADISDYGTEHIFFGTAFKGKASGYHYEGISASGTIEAGTKSAEDAFGVYKAKVFMNGLSKKVSGGFSTFYPKKWTSQQVVDAIKEAYANKQLNQGSMNMYTGTTKSGMQIEMILEPNGLIKSAYPVYNS